MMMLQMMMEIYGYNGNNKTVQASSASGISSLPQFCLSHPFLDDDDDLDFWYKYKYKSVEIIKGVF